MKSSVFVSKLKDIAENYKTLYILGCFGAPMTTSNKQRYTNNYPYNTGRADIINKATPDTFGFDCVCLIKGVLWGWNGNKNHIYGGATYGSNRVADIGTETMLNYCQNISADFSKIEVGELLWKQGHVGVYIGDGLAVECTPAWKNNVQITAVGNIGKKAGYNVRNWTKHGKLPWVDYSENTTKERTLAENLEILRKHGVINTPSHWLETAPKVEYLELLIANMAKALE